LGQRPGRETARKKADIPEETESIAKECQPMVQEEQAPKVVGFVRQTER
jgi:hypothetical protein